MRKWLLQKRMNNYNKKKSECNKCHSLFLSVKIHQAKKANCDLGISYCSICSGYSYIEWIVQDEPIYCKLCRDYPERIIEF